MATFYVNGNPVTVQKNQSLLRYLRDEAPAAGAWFTLPLDRQGMARFLGADRSALSRVLSQLKSEGLIAYRKSEFWVK